MLAAVSAELAVNTNKIIVAKVTKRVFLERVIIFSPLIPMEEGFPHSGHRELRQYVELD
jgi:hypothetical protein